MKKCELLSPAGNMEMLKYAVQYGADAVYLAADKFGARKYASNFSREELSEAVNYVHKYGVRLYLTMNTLVRENEIEEFVSYVKFIYEIGIDAVLIQDFGMLVLLRSIAPDLEIHASTQMHNNGSSVLEILREYGVKRVVLDREMSLEEITKLPTDIEKEVFCHGALCVSYSGQCLFSSLVLGRSGNRGECAGMCRLPYKALKNNEKKYYFSLKDLCTLEELDKILKFGVDCVKIEGRMKSPEYVGYTTKMYREAIDSYYEGMFRKPEADSIKNMKLLFYRGFTKGYILGADNHDMVSRNSNNHIGIHLGVYSIFKDKIKMILEDELVQGDVIRFKNDEKGMTVNFLYNINDKLVSSACKGDVVFVDNFLGIQKSGEVCKVESIKLMNDIRNLPKRKVAISGRVIVKKDEPLKLFLYCGKNEIEVQGHLVETAKNAPISEDDVRRQVDRLGNTIYCFEKLDVDIGENVFISVRDLNEIRREGIEKLEEAQMHTYEKPLINEFTKKMLINTDINPVLDVVISSESQYAIAKKYATRIFTNNEELAKKYDDIFIKFEENTQNFKGSTYIVGDLGSLRNIEDNDNICTDYMFNVLNSYTANELIKNGIKTICLSVESSLENTKEIAKYVDSSFLEVFLYGKIELMKMKFDPLYDKADKYLIDRNGESYKIKYGKSLKYLIGSLIDDRQYLSEYFKVGIKKFRIDFYDEDSYRVEEILRSIHKKLFQE